MSFDFLVLSMSHPLTWSRLGLGLLLQPDPLGRLRCSVVWTLIWRYSPCVCLLLPVPVRCPSLVIVCSNLCVSHVSNHPNSLHVVSLCAQSFCGFNVSLSVLFLLSSRLCPQAFAQFILFLSLTIGFSELLLVCQLVNRHREPDVLFSINLPRLFPGNNPQPNTDIKVSQRVMTASMDEPGRWNSLYFTYRSFDHLHVWFFLRWHVEIHSFLVPCSLVGKVMMGKDSHVYTRGGSCQSSSAPHSLPGSSAVSVTTTQRAATFHQATTVCSK